MGGNRYARTQERTRLYQSSAVLTNDSIQPRRRKNHNFFYFPSLHIFLTYFFYGRCGASTYMYIINKRSKEDKHFVVSSILLRRLTSDKISNGELTFQSPKHLRETNTICRRKNHFANHLPLMLHQQTKRVEGNSKPCTSDTAIRSYCPPTKSETDVDRRQLQRKKQFNFYY